nr:PREDICTED: protein CROWDED NUCLEI 3-like [Latimeria chalumnae]|eukprot:XP_014344827.1 PREDICTED: protein CROWDED NUCLEI 3-like [Latimeria chalumnae]
MLRRMKELELEINTGQWEVGKKENTIEMLKTEKENLQRDLQATSDANSREKLLLMEEVIQLKKLKEISNQDINHKESELMKITQELENTGTAVKDREHHVTLLETRLHQQVELHQAAERQLTDKRSEFLKAQSSLHQLEEKYYTSTASMQDKIAKELKEEIQKLRQQLRDKEMSAEEDKFLRNKMGEDCGRLTKENALLHSQVLEFTKQLERERLLRDEKNSRHSSSISQLASLKEQERLLEIELGQLKRMVEEEKQKVLGAMDQLHHLEQGKSSADLNSLSIRSHLKDLERRYSTVQLENSQLCSKKVNLVEHISQLHTQISDKEDEIHRMKGHIHILSADVKSLRSHMEADSSLQSLRWQEFSSIASNMQQIASAMGKR